MKIKSLAEEARIIRLEERRAKAAKKTYELNCLHDHRVHKVRRAARTALLAYGFLRNVPYRSIEAKCREEPSWNEVKNLIKRFTGKEPDLEDWAQ